MQHFYTDAARVERKTYKKYSTQDRKRILDAADKGNDWSELAASLNVSYKTAHRWVTDTNEIPLKRGGCKPRSLTEDEIETILTWIEVKPDITLREISSKIFGEFEKRVCISTVSNTLHGRMYSIKAVHVQPVAMNSLDNKTKRASYVNQLNEYIRAGKQVVWIDETNFNLFCRRKFGWSRVGFRAVQRLPTSRGPNIHLIGAIGTSGIIQLDRRRGSFKADSANEWVQRLLSRWEDSGNQLSDLVVVCDNAPCHSRLERIFDNSAATLLRLSPYSPMLNPIETIWSKIKTEVKSNMTVPTAYPPNVGEQRLAYLEGVIDNSKTQISTADCSRAIQHTTTFHPKALALEDMPVGE